MDPIWESTNRFILLPKLFELEENHGMKITREPKERMVARVEIEPKVP